MPDIIYCNAFEISHNKEVFCMVFKFLKPDGGEISMVVITTPQGCKTVLNLSEAEMTEYEAKHGKVEAWKPAKNAVVPTNPITI